MSFGAFAAVGHDERERVVLDEEGHDDRNAAHGGLARELAHEGAVEVAHERHAAAKPLGEFAAVAQREPDEAPAGGIGTVDGKAVDLLVVAEIGEAVAVGKRDARSGTHEDFARLDALAAADGAARVLGALELGELVGLCKLTAVHEVVGSAPLEALLGIGREAEGRDAVGGAGEFGASRDDGIELLTVPGRDVLHVDEVLEAALDLEGRDARVDQGLEIVGLVVVAQRKHVAAAGDLLARLRVDVVG